MKTLLILLFIASSIIGQGNNEKYSRDTREIDLFMQQTGRSSQLLTLTIQLSWLDEFISLWDEYAEECVSTYTYVVKTYWFEQPVLEFSDYESFRKWNATWGDNYKAEIQSKQPDPIEFITVFLRNKLKEN